MASIAKFDSWLNSAGNTYNTVVGVTYTSNTTTYSTNGSDVKMLEGSITTKLASSKILVNITFGHGAYAQDVDLSAACGYKTGATSATIGDYTSLHGTLYTRRYSALGSFWAQDTSDPSGGSWNGGYFVMARNYQNLHAPAVSAGVTLNYSLWVGSGGGTMYWNRAYSGSTDNGHISSITLMEIAQ